MAEMTTSRGKADTLEIAEPLIIISIGQTYQEGQSDCETYEDVRKWWRINPHRASEYQLVLARYEDKIVGAYRPTEWVPDDAQAPVRYGFVGEPAEFYAWRFYVGKWVPREYRQIGAANPILYCDEVHQRW